MLHGEVHINGEADQILLAQTEHRAIQRESENVPANEEDGLRAEYEDKIHTLYQKFEKTFLVLVGYHDNQTDPRMIRMSTRIMALLWRFRLAAGGDGSSAIARACGVKDKQTAQKCLALLQTQIGFPPLPGQRATNGRDNMSAARKKQIAKAQRIK